MISKKETIAVAKLSNTTSIKTFTTMNMERSAPIIAPDNNVYFHFIYDPAVQSKQLIV
jgi:hypothetical protein